MGWDAEDVALLKKLWAAGPSAAQIARHLGYSRNAVCAKLTRLDLKRRHKPPTANPKIRPVPHLMDVIASGELKRPDIEPIRFGRDPCQHRSCLALRTPVRI